jgi:hypothetical protein
MIQDIKAKNEKDARFMSLLEEAREKSRVLRTIDYKGHINKILE